LERPHIHAEDQDIDAVTALAVTGLKGAWAPPALSGQMDAPTV
jgi:hypothetical protein